MNGYSDPAKFEITDIIVESSVSIAWSVMYYVVFKIQCIRDKIESDTHQERLIRFANTKCKQYVCLTIFFTTSSLSLLIYGYLVKIEEDPY